MGNGGWELEDEVVIQVTLHYLFGIELVLGTLPMCFNILDHELVHFRDRCFVVKSQIFVWELAFMNGFEPARWEVESGLSRMDLDLLEIFLPVRHALV